PTRTIAGDRGRRAGADSPHLRFEGQPFTLPGQEPGHRPQETGSGRQGPYRRWSGRPHRGCQDGGGGGRRRAPTLGGSAGVRDRPQLLPPHTRVWVRDLPWPGRVLVEPGAWVQAETIVAEGHQSGPPVILDFGQAELLVE